MSETNNPSSAGSSGTTHDSLGKRLPDVAETLGRCQIAKVLATYASGLIAIAYVDKDDRPILPLYAFIATGRIAAEFHAILTARYPTHENDESSGSFEWHCANDTLEHRHTVVRHGL